VTGLQLERQMYFTTVQLQINFKVHSLTTHIKIPGSLPSTSSSKEVSAKLGKAPSHRYVFPGCLNDCLLLSPRRRHTSTLDRKCSSRQKASECHTTESAAPATAACSRACAGSVGQPRGWAGRGSDDGRYRDSTTSTHFWGASPALAGQTTPGHS